MVFLTVRTPVMYHQPGGQDEDCYAVPGLTILQCGIPRLPHVPARNPESVYFHADDALFSEPPLYFYYQALFYAVLPDVYGTARLASAIAGLLGVVLVYDISRAAGISASAGLAVAALLSWSRWFYFPAISARPDILCGTLGFAAILSILRWRRSGATGSLIFAGACIGLGGLTHPFAIVYAVQLAVWVAFTSRRWGRLAHPALLAGIALLVFAVWTPLIATYPEAFRVQFRNQFFGDAGGSIWQRAVLPFPSLLYHFDKMWEHIGAIQFLMASAGLIGCSLLCLRPRYAGLRPICGLAWSSVYLISILVGPHHPVIGYWVYPAGLAFVCVGGLLQQMAGWVTGGGELPMNEDAAATNGENWLPASHAVSRHISNPRRRTIGIDATTVALLVLLLPGSGLRTLVVHLRNWNDINYDSPRFARQLIDSLPADAVCAVDTQFALDFVAAGRRTLLATTLPQYFRVDHFSFDVLIVSRYGEDNQIARELPVQFIRTEGLESDKFACFAKIYRSTDQANSEFGESAD